MGEIDFYGGAKTYADIAAQTSDANARALFAVRFGMHEPYDPTKIAVLGNATHGIRRPDKYPADPDHQDNLH